MLEKISSAVECDEVLELLNRHYNLHGKLKAITGERDYNFCLTENDDTRYIVKIAHEDEAFETLDFQSKALAHIAKQAPQIPIAADVPNLLGEAFTATFLKNQQRRFLRVNTFMPGIALCDVARTPATRQAIGSLSAALSLALEDFSHPAEQRVLLWDIEQAAALKPHIETLSAAPRKTVEVVLNDFLKQQTSSLRFGVIHNDLNLHNLFVASENHSSITGCIDFGDMLHAPLVNDLAIATAYQLDVENPLQSIVEVAGAYHAKQPLLAVEVDQLLQRIAMRFVLTLTITHWRSRLHPENATYILRNAASAWAGLQALAEIQPATARDFLYDHLKPTTVKT
jgi:hydroxylysine kinase